MSKKGIVLGIIIILLIVIGGVYWGTRQPAEDQTPQTPQGLEKSLSPTEAPRITLVTYEDPAGFSISLPDDLRVVTADDFDDQVDYAKIYLQGEDEQMLIWMSDTKYKKVSDWLSEDDHAPQEPDLIGAFSLGGVSAEQHRTETNLYTLGIDQGVLYYVSSPNDDQWQETHETVVSSFKFAGNETASGRSGAGGGENIIYEVEEVIE